MEKLIKTNAVFNTPGECKVKLTSACCYLIPSKVMAAVNGHSIHKVQVELAM